MPLVGRERAVDRVFGAASSLPAAAVVLVIRDMCCSSMLHVLVARLEGNEILWQR